MARRCGSCGQYAKVVILTEYGYLGWTHRSCARRWGIVVK